LKRGEGMMNKLVGAKPYPEFKAALDAVLGAP